MTEVPDRGRQAPGTSPPGRADRAGPSRDRSQRGVEFAAQPGRAGASRVGGSRRCARSRNAAASPSPVEILPRLPVADGAHRGQVQRCGGVGVREARASDALRRGSPRRASRRTARAMRSCSTARSRGREHELEHAHGQARRGARVRCQSEIGRPLSAIHLERALDALRIGGVDARAASGSTCASSRMHRRPADAARPRAAIAARIAGSASGIGDRPCSSAWKYRPVPPARIGTLPRATMSSHRGARIARELGGRIRLATDRAHRSGGAARARSVVGGRASPRRCPGRDRPAPSRR